MKKSKRKYEEVNYWESMADSMVGLLLCILLITLLLILYLVRIPDDDYVDSEHGYSYEQYNDPDDGGGNHAYGNVDDEYGDETETETESETEKETEPESETEWNPGGGGAGGNGANPYEDPDPGSGEGEGNEKAAVFVQVVDGETGRTIKKSGIEFELYGIDSALQVLSTYYPVKTDYKKYETDKSGVFYFPEKLYVDSYYLHQLSTLAGYDMVDQTAFAIDKDYDWEDPFVVTVSLYPSKNFIRMKLVDKNTGEAITDASFEVVAAEDIITQDGTTRYKQGDVVDTLTVDEEGYAESMELYLGKYLLRQSGVPEYYAKITSDTAVEVENKTEAGTPAIRELTEEKTRVIVSLVDALYDTQYISDAEFKITLDNGTMVQTVKTDAKGRFTLTDLKKNTTYYLEQLSTAQGYQTDNTDHTFTVNGEGLIDGEKQADFQIKNRIIRISIGVQSKILKGQVSDVNVALKDASGEVMEVWNTTGLEHTLTGLAPGEYMVILNGNEDQEQKIVVENKTELQQFRFERWTTADIGILLALGLIFIGLIVLFVVLVKHTRRKKTEDKE